MNKQSRIAPAAASSAPAIGAAATPSPGTQTEKRAETGGPVLPPVGAGSPTFPCRHCEGSGETEYLGLCDDRWRRDTCWDCDGSGVEDPYCECCGSKLTADLYCPDCEASDQLVFVERIAPGSIAA